MRLILYKRIASAEDDAALTLLAEEMADRFGDREQRIEALHALFDRLAGRDNDAGRITRPG